MRVGIPSAGGSGRIERPRLLFLCQSLPYPPDGGVHLRSFNILRLLARDFDVVSLLFFRRAARPTREEVASGLDGVRELGAAEAFPIPQEWSRARLVWDHARSTVRGRVYTRFLYQSEAFDRALDRTLREHRFAVAHVDSLDLSAYLPRLADLPVVLTHHNVESQLLARRAEVEESFLMRRYLAFQAHLAEKEERAWCPRVDLNVLVSEADRETLRKVVGAPSVPAVVVPNGVDTRVFRPADGGGGEGIVFVGGASWLPNLDAMEYFCAEILPIVRREVQDVPVTWVGRASAGVREDFGRRFGIEVTGYVEDVRPYVHRAACYVVPIRIGGGTRLKILDAWAMGAAVVSTPVGCEGLEAREGENMLVREDAGSFAAAVVRILHERELRRKLGAEGRRTAESTYDWDVIGRDMLPRYHELARVPAI